MLTAVVGCWEYGSFFSFSTLPYFLIPPLGMYYGCDGNEHNKLCYKNTIIKNI